MNKLQTLGGATLIALLSACSAVTTMTSSQPGTTVHVGAYPVQQTPSQGTYTARSFGYDEFKAEAPGQEPLYGVLPLKFNGGYLASSIIFFAPAMLYSLREVYPEYEFDLSKREVRFRKHHEDPWQVYVPTAEDEQVAREYYAGFLQKPQQ